MLKYPAVYWQDLLKLLVKEVRKMSIAGILEIKPQGGVNFVI